MHSFYISKFDFRNLFSPRRFCSDKKKLAWHNFHFAINPNFSKNFISLGVHFFKNLISSNISLFKYLTLQKSQIKIMKFKFCTEFLLVDMDRWFLSWKTSKTEWPTVMLDCVLINYGQLRFFPLNFWY